MLTLLYTGDGDIDIIKEEPLAFMSVASEYDLPWLKTLAEPSCIHSLGEGNLKEFWQASRLYESVLLRDACIKYVQQNPLIVLANSEIINLKFEDPMSWNEFSQAISQESQS